VDRSPLGGLNGLDQRFKLDWRPIRRAAKAMAQEWDAGIPIGVL
jgi:hypothetical protein